MVGGLSIFHVLVIFSIKILVALFITRSFSFVTELADSILDLLAVAITYIGLKESRKPADYQHMFGHYKVNSATAFIQALFIIGLYAVIAYQAIATLATEYAYRVENSIAGSITLAITLGLVFIDSTIIMRIGKRSNNPLIIAQGVNFRGDLYRNITVIVGLTIVSFGIFVLDLLLAALFSIISVYKGFKVLKQSFDELIDTNAIGQDIIEDIRTEMRGVVGVVSLDALSIKTAGNTLDAIISVRVDDKNSVQNAGRISGEIRSLVEERFSETYSCNIIIQVNSSLGDDGDEVEHIFHTIDHLAKMGFPASNIHNILIDLFKDKLVVQLHIDADPSGAFSDAHVNATKIEGAIAEKIRKSFPLIVDVDITSHLEPARATRKEHSHIMREPSQASEIITAVSMIARAQHGIIDVVNFKTNEEDGGIFMILTMIVDGRKSMEEIHQLTENLENEIFRIIPVIKRVTVHAEPDHVGDIVNLEQ